MSTCGAGWGKTDKNGKPYISFNIDKAFLPLTIDNTKRLAAFPVKEKKTENSPDFILDLFVLEEKQQDNTADDVSDFL